MQRVSSFLVGDADEIDPATIHISQVGDELFNAGAPGSSANCGPASLIMALRLIGAQVPGAERYRGEDLISHVRFLATGSHDRLRGTNNLHLQHVIELAGCRWRALTDTASMLRAVGHGQPVIMSGNPTAPGCYTERYDYLDVRRWNGGHWIVVSRYNHATRDFTVNDPQSVIGPIRASARELYAFARVDGGFGLAVRR